VQQHDRLPRGRPGDKGVEHQPASAEPQPWMSVAPLGMLAG
jgi:hypothetical protein